MAMEFERGSQSVSAGAVLEPTHPCAPSFSAIRLGRPWRSDRGIGFWSCLVALSVLGAVGISPALLSLWDIWTNDPLRSIGMLIVPAAIFLTLRVWRQCGWELDGTWWGLLPVLSAFLMSNSSGRLAWNIVAGDFKFDLLAPKLALYLFVSGLVLLFAGTRVWRQAWFPLALLLFAQPVPTLSSRILDLPLQNLSAHVARSFAASIGFSPANTELLRLMFTPAFGMFIAPGCDGLRGAVTLGYAALIVGYLKRVSFPRWIAYVVGAVLLGYLFNLIRLCALVLYYRIAVGHPLLEHYARRADYAIGACLILFATFLFLLVISRKTAEPSTSQPESPRAALPVPIPDYDPRADNWKAAAFAAMALAFAVPGALALRDHRPSFAATVSDGALTPAQLDQLMPRQAGEYKLDRSWQEEADGRIALESASYSAPPSDAVILGVWLPPSRHSMHESWSARGQDPQLRADRTLPTANGRPVLFDTAFYSDGITDSFAGNAICTPSSCLFARHSEPLRVEFTLNPTDFNTRGVRAVPLFFRVEIPHSDKPAEEVRRQLCDEALRFLSNVDFADLSRRFQ
jgi:exosortase J